MAETRLRALVLGAGRGERLRPLTDVLPKPLLPILGRPVVEQTLGALAAAGCEATAINLHHLGAAIESRFSGAFGGMRLIYSREETCSEPWAPWGRSRTSPLRRSSSSSSTATASAAGRWPRWSADTARPALPRRCC